MFRLARCWGVQQDSWLEDELRTMAALLAEITRVMLIDGLRSDGLLLKRLTGLSGWLPLPLSVA